MKRLLYFKYFYIDCGFGLRRSWELAGNVVESIKRWMVQL